VFGGTPIIAARVQAAAEPGAVLITEAVHKLIAGLFMVEDRGAQALSGIERLVHLYQVTRTSGVRGRLQAAAAARALTPLRRARGRVALVNDSLGAQLGG